MWEKSFDIQYDPRLVVQQLPVMEVDHDLYWKICPTKNAEKISKAHILNDIKI